MVLVCVPLLSVVVPGKHVDKTTSTEPRPVSRSLQVTFVVLFRLSEGFTHNRCWIKSNLLLDLDENTLNSLNFIGSFHSWEVCCCFLNRKCHRRESER